jgi:hypothetical protein
MHRKSSPRAVAALLWYGVSWELVWQALWTEILKVRRMLLPEWL